MDFALPEPSSLHLWAVGSERAVDDERQCEQLQPRACPWAFLTCDQVSVGELVLVKCREPPAAVTAIVGRHTALKGGKCLLNHRQCCGLVDPWHSQLALPLSLVDDITAIDLQTVAVERYAHPGSTSHSSQRVIEYVGLVHQLTNSKKGGATA